MGSTLREPDLRHLLERLADEMPIPMDVLPGALDRARRKLWRNVIASVALASLLVVGSVGGVRAILRSAPAPRPADTPTRAPAPDGWTRFQSPLYGYSIDLPPGWTVQPAALTWEWGESFTELGILPSRADLIQAPARANDAGWPSAVGIAAMSLPVGMADEDWHRRVSAYELRDDPDCAGGPSESVQLDRATGQLTTDCDGYVTVTFVSQDRGYLMQTFEPFDSRMELLLRVLATLGPNPAQVTEPPDATAWRGIYPQATRQEAEEAQRRADEGDPAFTWQVDPNGNQAEYGAGDVVAMRFLEERLGWEGYRVPYGTWSGEPGFGDLVFVRCQPGIENAAFPDENCAPANGDAFTAVLVRIERLADPTHKGIWIVTRWAELPPFEQAVPPSEQEVRDLVGGFMEARLAGTGAEAYLLDGRAEVQDLYETSEGMPFERFEIDRIEPPTWPDGWVQVQVRLFADGGNVVVEQPLRVVQRGPVAGMSVPDGRRIVVSGYTTENGEAIYDENHS